MKRWMMDMQKKENQLAIQNKNETKKVQRNGIT